MAGDVVFVTGAAGFIGSAVARALVAEGNKVRALVRPSSPRDNLDIAGLELIEGDMRDPRAVAKAAAGARYVFHIAADYRLWSRDPQEIVRNNTTGTAAVLGAAKQAGAERVVYTSSVATLRMAIDGSCADETMPLEAHRAIGAYKLSKIAAERLALDMITNEGLPLVIVNPSTPIGPNDVRPTPTGRIVVEAASGRIPAFVDTGLNVVHVEDVARGHLLALRQGRIGERYVLGGENLAFSDILAEIARLCGRRAPRLRLPRHAVFPLAFAAERLAHVTGREPLVTLDGLRMAKYRMFVSSAKAQQELGYTARPARQALQDALTWFRTRGWVA